MEGTVYYTVYNIFSDDARGLNKLSDSLMNSEVM